MDDFKIEMEETPSVYHHSLWVEKYRPSNVDSFIGNPSFVETLKLWIEKKDIPHIFLYGSPGVGKSSAAKIIINSIPCDSLFINASDETGVESIRNKVQDFAMTMGMTDLKIIVEDECLEEDTLVSVIKDGEEQKISIKNLNDSSDLVKSLNLNGENIEWKPFVLHDKGIRNVIEIEFENGEIIQCTAEHKWYVEDANGNPIKMKTGDIIKNKIENILNVSRKELGMVKLKIKSIKYTGNKKHVYDLTVDQNHNFFVGSKAVLTSNCDRISPEGQCIMRNLMETYSASTRFILTANYPERIIPAIKSRCQSYEIKPPSMAVAMAHVVNILDLEKISYKKEDVASIIKSYFPDLRKIINFAQQSSVTGILKIANINATDQDFREKLIGLLKQPKKADIFTEIRQLVANSSFSNYEEVYKYLFDHVDEYAGVKAPEVILYLADAVYQSALVFEREITFVAAMHRILAILK